MVEYRKSIRAMLSTARQVATGLIRAMVVDDSAVVRGLITRMPESESGIEAVASVANGRAALSGLPLDGRAPYVLTHLWKGAR